MTDTTPLELQTPAVAELARQSTELAASYAGYTVTTEQRYVETAEVLRRIKAQQKIVEEKRKAITGPMDQAKTAVMNFFRPFAERLMQAEADVKAAMINYNIEQRRIAQEGARKEQEAAAKREAKLRADAELAREQGKQARAEILETRADAVVAAPVAPAIVAPKVAGISTRQLPKWKVTDPALVPDQYKTIDEKKINGVVRALGMDANIPGVHVWLEESIAAGSNP